MRHLLTLITGSGDYLLGLSNQTKKWLVVGFLCLLGGGSIYKLVHSIHKLNDPLPVATPEQFIAPMSELVRQTSGQISTYQRGRQHQLSRLDSLEKAITDKNHSHHATRNLPKSF